MPRDLADVLHYFLPEADPNTDRAEPEPRPTFAAQENERRPLLAPDQSPDSIEPAHSLALPILGLPIGERDVVRAALCWNLAIETARLGASTVIVTPVSDAGSPLWPESGRGPLGTELVYCDAKDLYGLYDVAQDLAMTHADRSRRGGIVFVRIPPAWLDKIEKGTRPIRWLLLLTSSNRRDLSEAYELAKTLIKTNPKAEIGVTIHGVNTIAEAKTAFETISRVSLKKLGLVLSSYGLLVDDLDVYRAIAAQRPISLAHPQAPAARALGDVARLLFEDARSRVLG